MKNFHLQFHYFKLTKHKALTNKSRMKTYKTSKTYKMTMLQNDHKKP